MPGPHESAFRSSATDESWLEVLLEDIDRQPWTVIVDRLVDLKLSGEHTKHFLWGNARSGAVITMYAGPFEGAGRNPYHRVVRVVINEGDRLHVGWVTAKDYTLDLDSGEVGLCQSTITPQQHDKDTGPLLRCTGTSMTMFTGERYDESLGKALDTSIDSQNGTTMNLESFLGDTEPFLKASHTPLATTQLRSY